MMAAIRRLLGLEHDDTEVEAKKARDEQFDQIQRGLHEAAQRVHFLEIESELKSHGWHKDRS